MALIPLGALAMMPGAVSAQEQENPSAPGQIPDLGADQSDIVLQQQSDQERQQLSGQSTEDVNHCFDLHGIPADALVACNKLLINRNAANSAAIYMGRSFVYDRMGNHQRAIDDLTEALNERPNDPDALYFRAWSISGAAITSGRSATTVRPFACGRIITKHTAIGALCT